MQARADKPNTAKEPSKAKTITIQTLFLYLVFPLSQVVTLLVVAQEINALYSIPVPVFYTIAGVLLSLLVVLIYFLYSNRSKKQTEKNYQELADLQQFQKKQYEKFQKQRLELEILKNSFEQQLNEISVLLEKEQPKKALELLQTLSTIIASTKEYPFCPNPVINAVLCEKKQQCNNQSILFQTDIQIGDCASVDPLHLCSIFSNLLDNAIEACTSLSENKFIHLTAKQSGDFIHIKVENSSLMPSAPKQGHGYGHRILNDIAAQYSGSFRSTYKNNIYEAYFSIQMP